MYQQIQCYRCRREKFHNNANGETTEWRTPHVKTPQPISHRFTTICDPCQAIIQEQNREQINEIRKLASDTI